MTDRRIGSPTSDEFRGVTQTDEPELFVDTWSTSRERDIYLQRRLSILLAVGFALALALTGWLLLKPASVSGKQWWGSAILGLACVVLLWCLVPYWASRRAYLQRRRATAAARVDRAIQELGDGEPPLPLTKLFRLNRRQLDEYQEQTKKQQRSAYLLTQVASVVAFLAIVIGILLSFQDSTTTEKYIVTGLSGLGGLLSAFLARTFYRGYEDSNKELYRYYSEPQRTGRILAAERLAVTLNDAPSSGYAERMIETLLGWEVPGEDVKTSNVPSEEEDSAPVTTGSVNGNSGR